MRSMRVRFAGSALAVVSGALAVACSGEDQEPESAVYSGEDGYVQCLRDAGFTDEEVALFTEREPGSEQILAAKDHPNLDALVKASAECVVSSGIGESGLTPERIAEDTAAMVGLADCMHDRGWREFPDPEPDSFGGLSIRRVDPPDDADQEAQFTEDFNDCSIEHLEVPLGGPIDDEGDLLDGGPAEDDHDHSDDDH